jgi:copper chaperone
MHLHIPDMHCGGCVASVTRILTALDPTASVQAELDGRTVQLTTAADAAAVLAALDDAGFPAELKD